MSGPSPGSVPASAIGVWLGGQGAAAGVWQSWARGLPDVGTKDKEGGSIVLDKILPNIQYTSIIYNQSCELRVIPT